MRKIIFLLLAMACLSTPVQAQLSKREINRRDSSRPGSREDYFINTLQLIDLPTASLLKGGHVSGSLLLFEEGGMLARLSAGISERMMFGISYGADYIIGDQLIKWNDAPAVHIAYRAVDETSRFFSVVLGLDTQGYGKYWRDSDYPGVPQGSIDATKVPYKRYTYKSRGFYVVASKNYRAFWNVGLHVGANYSLETSDKDRFPDLFCGMDWQLGRDLAVVGEYAFGFNNDAIPMPVGSNGLVRNNFGSKGFLNAGVRWAFQPNMFLEFSAKNLLADNLGNRDYVRVLKIVYFTRATDRDTRYTQTRKISIWERIFGSRRRDDNYRDR